MGFFVSDYYVFPMWPFPFFSFANLHLLFFIVSLFKDRLRLSTRQFCKSDMGNVTLKMSLYFPHAKEDNNNSSHIMRYYWYVPMTEEFACHVTLSPVLPEF